MGILDLFLSNIPLPVWIEGINGEILYLNKAYKLRYDLAGKSLSDFTIKDFFGEELHKIYRSNVEKCKNSKEAQICFAKVKGQERQCHIFPLIDDEGEFQGIAGIIRDAGIEKKQQEELQNQKNILRTIIDSLPEVIFYKDRDCRYVGYNKKFKEFYERKGVTEILGKTDEDICEDKQEALTYIEEDKKVMEGDKSVYIENVFSDNNGNRYFEESLKVPVIDEKGQAWGIVGLARDITGRKLLEEKLRKLSYTDNLTGLYNRTYFEEKLRELNLEQCLPLGIIMGDVNGLKLINDSFGHLEGDRLIMEIAAILDIVCGKEGFVFRWGGDEFMILMPNCDEARCEELIGEIQRQCSATEYSYIKLSIAIGGIVKKSLDENNYKLIKEVEEMVYRQKLLERDSITSSMLTSLQKSLETKSMETEEHCQRVEAYAMAIGKEIGMKLSELNELTIVARLHDVGKIAIGADILLKPGKLTAEEFEVMKTHAEKGYRIINASSMLGNVAKCVLTHHERWDGAGYPLGLSGEEIPLMARIVAIADAYDVMTHDRIYKKAISKEAACKELLKCSGTQFDSKLVKLFIKNLVT